MAAEWIFRLVLHNTLGRKHWSRVHHQEPPPPRPHTTTRNLLHPALTPPASTVQQEAMPGRSLQFREAEVASLKTSRHLPSLLRSSPHWPGRERGYTFDTLAELVRSSDAHLQNTFSSHKQDPLPCRVEACVVWCMRLITISLSESAQGNPEPFSGGITFLSYCI